MIVANLYNLCINRFVIKTDEDPVQVECSFEEKETTKISKSDVIDDCRHLCFCAAG